MEHNIYGHPCFHIYYEVFDRRISIPGNERGNLRVFTIFHNLTLPATTGLCFFKFVTFKYSPVLSSMSIAVHPRLSTNEREPTSRSSSRVFNIDGLD